MELKKACGNSRGQLKTQQNFQEGCSRRKTWNSHGSWFLILVFGIPPRCVTILQNLQGLKLVVFPEFLRVKIQNLKIPGSFRIEVYPQPPLFGFFLEQPILHYTVSYFIINSKEFVSHLIIRQTQIISVNIFWFIYIIHQKEIFWPGIPE